VNDFLQNDLLAQAGASAQARPDTKPDPELKVRTALDRAAAGIDGKFEAQPLVEASIRLTIGKTYEDLGLYPEAERHVGRAVDLRHRVLGEADTSLLTSMSDMARLYTTAKACWARV
jgi:eukaryotic-like serine/threonine-protein kinase